MVVTTEAVRRAKLLQSSCHYQKTPNFLQDKCSYHRPTNGVRALKVKVSHSTDLITSPQAHIGSPNQQLTGEGTINGEV